MPKGSPQRRRCFVSGIFKKKMRCVSPSAPSEVTVKYQEHKPACLGPHISAPLKTCF